MKTLAPMRQPREMVLDHIQNGCFQRSMSLLVAGTSVASGLEVAYEHYKGSYSNPMMYTPVAFSGVLALAGVAGVFSERAARTFLRYTSYITLADGLIGFGFHVRGIARKPGGWRLPVTNIVMGPPIFAPLLFGTSAWLGVMASYLRREGAHQAAEFSSGWRHDLAHGRFQKHLSAVTLAWAFFCGFEAWYSHYKTNFRYRSQWIPVALAPALMLSAGAAIVSRRAARTLLPATSLAAIAVGAVGFYFHARGVAKRAGGLKKPLYNTIYGPPIFAPLLFAACGTLGMLAAMLRREGSCG
jgi:hypothetical protein